MTDTISQPPTTPVEAMSSKRRPVIFILVGLFSILVVFLVIKALPVSLTINTFPADSTILVDEASRSLKNGSVKLWLKKGTHRVVAQKTGYFSEDFQLNLQSTKTIDIHLVPALPSDLGKTIDVTTKANIYPVSSHIAFAVDEETQQLVRTDLETGTSTPIPLPDSPTINSVSLLEGTILIETEAWPSTNPHQYYFLDINSNATTKLPVDQLQPLVGMSLSKDREQLAVLGNYSISTDKSSLYLLRTRDWSASLVLSDAPANSLQWVGNELILLINEKDPKKFSSSSIFDVRSKNVSSFTVPPNILDHPTSHPSRPTIAYVSGNRLVYANLITKTTDTLLTGLPENVVLWWLDENNLLIANNSNQTIQKLNVDLKSASQPMPYPTQISGSIISVIPVEGKWAILYSDVLGSKIDIAFPNF